MTIPGQHPEAKEARASVSSETLLRLRREILSGEFSPGERLNLDQLRLAYDVSLSPLREALSRLVSEGLVLQSQDQRGFQVAPVSRENLNEVTALRKTLEVMALKQSMQHGTEAWETEIVATLYRLSKLKPRDAATGNVDEDWEYWHGRFHAALRGACHAPVLLQFCDILHGLSDRYRRMTLHARPQGRSRRDVHVEHQAIADAVLQRDVKKACALLEQHIDLTGSMILACWSRESARKHA